MTTGDNRGQLYRKISCCFGYKLQKIFVKGHLHTYRHIFSVIKELQYLTAVIYALQNLIKTKPLALAMGTVGNSL